MDIKMKFVDLIDLICSLKRSFISSVLPSPMSQLAMSFSDAWLLPKQLFKSTTRRGGVFTALMLLRRVCSSPGFLFYMMYEK